MPSDKQPATYLKKKIRIRIISIALVVIGLIIFLGVAYSPNNSVISNGVCEGGNMCSFAESGSNSIIFARLGLGLVIMGIVMLGLSFVLFRNSKTRIISKR